MISIVQTKPTTRLLKLLRSQALETSLGSDGHEDGQLDRAMWKVQDCCPGFGSLLRISYTYGMMWSCRTGLSCVGRIRWMVIWKCCKTLGGRVMTRRKRLRECTHRTFCPQLEPQGRGRVGRRWHLSGVEKGARYLLCRRRIISAVVELRQRRADFHGHLHVRLGFPNLLAAHFTESTFCDTMSRWPVDGMRISEGGTSRSRPEIVLRPERETRASHPEKKRSFVFLQDPQINRRRLKRQRIHSMISKLH